MPRPPRVIDTTVPLGLKINEVMAEKGMAGNYRQLATDFGVTVASAREWVQYGRMAKTRYGQLVEWSGRPLDWWFDAPLGDAVPAQRINEKVKRYNAGTPPRWPFLRISPEQYFQLSPEERSEIEGFAQAIVIQNQRKRKAA